MSSTFARLGVPRSICDALARRGITTPFEIQSATISDAMAGRDVCGRAPTGSGKTLAFGIPLIARAGRAEPGRPRALVLVPTELRACQALVMLPTRELADQISTELRSFAGPTRVGVVYGGVGYRPQLTALRRGLDVLVACPGRLEDLIDQGAVSLTDVEQVVLDEADRMADMGFMPAVRRLLDRTPDHRQTLLFSATLDGDVAKLTRCYQRDPVRHEVGRSTPDITAAHHAFWNTARGDRVSVTADAVTAVWPAIVFCRTRHGADRLARQLGRAGVDASAIHGGRSQGQRTRALRDFAKGRVQALVATDVAARGIHVDGVASVIHFDPPEDHKAYVHRSGRTARAGEGGVVVSLVQPEQARELRRMQRRIGLDEPFTTPDVTALRARSPAPARVPAERSENGDDSTGNRS
ncbi:MAG: DEAD/DEAH box helicase, partial [Acidimicrobiales bacterium]